jgi:hypothetical protein
VNLHEEHEASPLPAVPLPIVGLPRSKLSWLCVMNLDCISLGGLKRQPQIIPFKKTHTLCREYNEVISLFSSALTFQMFELWGGMITIFNAM